MLTGNSPTAPAAPTPAAPPLKNAATASTQQNELRRVLTGDLTADIMKYVFQHMTNDQRVAYNSGVGAVADAAIAARLDQSKCTKSGTNNARKILTKMGILPEPKSNTTTSSSTSSSASSSASLSNTLPPNNTLPSSSSKLLLAAAPSSSSHHKSTDKYYEAFGGDSSFSDGSDVDVSFTLITITICSLFESALSKVSLYPSMTSVPPNPIPSLVQQVLQQSSDFNKSLESCALAGRGLATSVLSLKQAEIQPSLLLEQSNAELQSKITQLELKLADQEMDFGRIETRLKGALEGTRVENMRLKATLQLNQYLISEQCKALTYQTTMYILP
ncbi:hypothetical protein BCR33DRAFT_784495 [Rhizoclosmatium globosum]|uniref:Uncharacterized protein n=1 Tax=Rhizoclosmatium globosum TaxID=329046 RepID=A0A1Y2CDD4_9FUNG|nr:hypothetical protein BCR33DRAFT_784495 [Rhizoclosmatium globosum]|eukprot:ORY45042.1 hypothetical protein BCR33DRAFT_784495 [Rhizoclosmatium globosum]